MFVEITQRDETRLLRRLGPAESLDPALHTDAWCQSNDLTRSKANGAIPSGCADYRCEIRRTKAPSPVIWAALDFLNEQEGIMP
jgi:hypothetical protein